MKTPVVVLLLVIQGATLALVAGLLMRDRSSELTEEFSQLRSNIQGAMHMQRELTLRLEELRLEKLAELQSGDRNPSSATETPKETIGGKPSSAAAEPYQETREILLRLKSTFAQLKRERAANNNFLDPLEGTLQEQCKEFLERGPGALHWVSQELGREPYETDRDPEFLVYLLENVVPALSTVDSDAAFKTARSALMNNAAESFLRYAAAHTLREIAPDLWVREVLPVITVSGNRQDAVVLRSRLMDLFVLEPHAEIVEVCRKFLTDRQTPEPLRNKAIDVLAKQETAAADPLLQHVLMEDPDALLKTAALGALEQRLGHTEDLKAVLDKVMAADVAKMPLTVKQRAQTMLDQWNEAKGASDGG